jgi:hypothetical protein
LAVLALALAGASLCGCRSQAEREASAEIARIAYAVDQLRDAPSNAKQQPLELLQKEPCSVPQACELQQVCVQGYSLHLRALQAASSVRAALQSGKANPEIAAELLQNSEQDLTKAKALSDRCVALEGELTREYLQH